MVDRLGKPSDEVSVLMFSHEFPTWLRDAACSTILTSTMATILLFFKKYYQACKQDF